MPSEAVVWSILFLPVAAFLITSLIIRPFLNRYSLLSGLLLILCLAIAFVLSLWALWASPPINAGLADLLIGPFVLPFEAVSVLLLAALIGGLALARPPGRT